MDRADNGSLKAGDDSGVFAATELDDVEVNGNSNVVDLVRRLASKYADEKGTVFLASGSEGLRGGVNDFDSGAYLGADGPAFINRGLAARRSEDDTKQIGPRVDRDAGMLRPAQTADLDSRQVSCELASHWLWPV
jgi:hypothetical protein